MFTKRYRGIPLGITDFKKIRDVRSSNVGSNELLFIDKSLLIKKVLEESAEVLLITRPRLFGKSINMSMLRYFFDIDGSGAKLFDNLIVTKDARTMKHMGQYPVVSLQLSTLKVKTFDGLCNKLRSRIAELYDTYSWLLEIASDNSSVSAANGISDTNRTSDTSATYNSAFKMNKLEIATYEEFLYKEIDIKDRDGIIKYESAIKFLIKLLHKYYNQKVILLIDDYDAPLMGGHSGNYSGEVTELFREIYSETLKDNPYLYKAIITGGVYIANDDVFSDVNLYVDTILKNNYSYFGLNESEIVALLHGYDIDSRVTNAATLKNWYGGYITGGEPLYNTWSVLNFLKDRSLTLYSLDLNLDWEIMDMLKQMKESSYDELLRLVQGKSIFIQLQDKVTVGSITNKQKIMKNFYNLMLHRGYFTATETNIYTATVKIVNNEVLYWFRLVLSDLLPNSMEFPIFLKTIMDAKMDELEIRLQKVLSDNITYNDLMLALSANLNEYYHIYTNCNLGNGVPDLVLEARDDAHYVPIGMKDRDMSFSLDNINSHVMDAPLLNYVFEFKFIDNDGIGDIKYTKGDISGSCEDLLFNMNNKDYDSYFVRRGKVVTKVAIIIVKDSSVDNGVANGITNAVAVRWM